MIMLMPSMKHVRAAVVAAACVATAVVARAQTTDFSGTWNFDESKSVGKPELVGVAGSSGAEFTLQGNQGGGGGGGGQGRGAGGRVLNPNRLVIKQDATDLNVTEGGLSLVYKLDGSENNVSALMRPGYPKAKTAWDSGKLVITSSIQVYVGKGQFEPRTVKEVYTLSGDTLTIEKTGVTPAGEKIDHKLVYTRAPKQ
jgi:hypothetical protein